MRRLLHKHLIFELWLTPWSWNRPSLWRSQSCGDWQLCFVVGQLVLIDD